MPQGAKSSPLAAGASAFSFITVRAPPILGRSSIILAHYVTLAERPPRHAESLRALELAESHESSALELAEQHMPAHMRLAAFVLGYRLENIVHIRRT